MDDNKFDRQASWSYGNAFVWEKSRTPTEKQSESTRLSDFPF